MRTEPALALKAAAASRTMALMRIPARTSTPLHLERSSPMTAVLVDFAGRYKLVLDHPGDFGTPNPNSSAMPCQTRQLTSGAPETDWGLAQGLSPCRVQKCSCATCGCGEAKGEAEGRGSINHSQSHSFVFLHICCVCGVCVSELIISPVVFP